MMFNNNIDYLVLMTFFMMYVFVLMLLFYIVKKRQSINSGDKELTLNLIAEAKKYNSDLYRITTSLRSRNRAKLTNLHEDDYNYFEGDSIPNDDYLTIINILNLYNSLCEGSSNRTLNRRIVDTLMSDNFSIAYKAFFPYFSSIRMDFNNQQLFVAFEYFNSTKIRNK